MRFLTAATLLMFTAVLGQAGTLNFSYSNGSDIFAGTMTGTLQGDNNTFVVSSFGPFTVGGGAGPSLGFVDSVDHSVYGVTRVPTVRLDGSYMDFVACSTSTCSDDGVFGFASGNMFAAAVTHAPFQLGSDSLGGSSAFNASKWSASVAADAPEPGTLTLGLAAALATALSRRKCLARQ